MGTKTPRMTVQQYKAMLQGTVNRAQGAYFEQEIEAACDYYRAAGVAHIEKNAEPMKPIRALNRQKGTFEAIYTKRAQPDYKGTLNGGRAVCFEAKHTDADRIRQEAVQPHQADALDLHETMGALCFVLVSLGHRYYRVPWNTWKGMQAACGHKYMDAQDLAPYEVRKTPRNRVILFLDGLMEENGQ